MNADSVKAKLKKFAMETGHTFQEALTYYGLERTIYRISVSKYAGHFVLKGGILLYALFDREYGQSHDEERYRENQSVCGTTDSWWRSIKMGSG